MDENKTVAVGTRLPQRQHRELKIYAAMMDKTIEQVVSQAVDQLIGADPRFAPQTNKKAAA